MPLQRFSRNRECHAYKKRLPKLRRNIHRRAIKDYQTWIKKYIISFVYYDK